ncbi:MAG: DUF1214 domain-containing protein [Actinobacteria bacterium]|nr:DUF1214 domain-containing protein [Actinomycetota bacterium]
MTDAASDATRLAAAFEAWLEAQRTARDWMLGAPVPHTEEDLAEGYRWVTRLASLAQEWFVERNDPFHPELFVSQSARRKLMVDNPDVTYWFGALDAAQTYRLRGVRGDAAYVGLTFGTPVGKGAVAGRTGTVHQTHLDVFGIGPGEPVDVWIAPTRPDGVDHWVPLHPDCGQVAVRETFHDRSDQRPSDLRLELVGDVPAPRCSADDLAPSLEFAALFLSFVGMACDEIWRGASASVNAFSGASGASHVESQESELRSHSDADMTYHGGLFRLADGEALEITVRPPAEPFVYWGLTTTNPWMESFDYRHRRTHINDRTAERNDDGTWTLLLAPEDPHHANWIDTGGRREGYMIVRWVLADEAPLPEVQVVSI